MWTSTFSAVYRPVWRNDEAAFRVAVRENLNTHNFLGVDGFVMCKDGL
jgi:hypothetical protein